MPLTDPPAPAVLAGLPKIRIAGRRLHRVFQAHRGDPWWFASLPAGAAPDNGGRFDLPSPLGACYLATSPVAAVLEALPEFSGLLPDIELRKRRRAEVTVPTSAPRAAALAATRARDSGVTAALWAGTDRARTQRWALALARAGWRALHHGVQHDPAGGLRAITLLDAAGTHLPFDDAGWTTAVHSMHDDQHVVAALARYGIQVTLSDVALPLVPLDASGLLDRPSPTVRRQARASGV